MKRLLLLLGLLFAVPAFAQTAPVSGYAYSNSGLSMRAYGPSAPLQPGEIGFAHPASTADLTAAFPAYAGLAQTQANAASAAEAYAAAIANGISVTSQSAPQINGVYAIDPTATANFNATSTYILTNGAFPGGGSSMVWFAASGLPHTFTSPAQFQAFATAVANYVAALAQTRAAIASGQPASWPSGSVSIP